MTFQTLDYEPKILDVAHLSLEQQCEKIWEETIRQERAEIRLRKQQPETIIWDGEWQMQHILTDEYEAELSWIDNDTGPGATMIPWSSPVAQWIYDMQGRIDRGERRNIHLTSQYCGARWGGRLDNATVRTTDEGDKILLVTWLHDYENVKWYSVWCNPFLPAAFQWPRVFILAGPVPWIGLLALHLQHVREHEPWVTIPDDPLDFSSYLELIDRSNWSVVTRDMSFLDSLDSGAIWGIISSRFANWHDMMRQQLDDGEFSTVCTRWLEGDPEPWPGANLRHGTLWIDIVDKSGVFIGTSSGGTMLDGLARTFAEFAEDFIDSTMEIVADVDVPTEYFLPGLRLTKARTPYVVFAEGDDSPIQTSDLIISPAKCVQVLAGGHSMPGINETISATITTGFGILGSLIGMGSIGTTIDSFVKPLYEDCILAWWHIKSVMRAQHSGWSRYLEYFQDGANKAYTIASLMVVRAGFWATKTTISTQITVIDASPWMVGDRGLGHFWLSDRIGVSLKDDPRRVIHIERCKRLDLKWSSDSPFPEWVITIGDDRAMQDPAQRAWGKIEAIVSALRELGVY